MSFVRHDRGEPDPRSSTPVDTFLKRDGRMVQVLESDWDGVGCEDVVTMAWVEITRRDLMQHWQKVRPLVAA
jgi:hypothetical protein